MNPWRTAVGGSILVFLVASILATGVGSELIRADEAETKLAEMDGNGTANDPYVITDAEELQAMEADLTAHYVLGNDIDASETESWNDWRGFDPVGTHEPNDETVSFSGTFDGNGYVISDLTIDRPTEASVGLFGGVRDGVVRDVHVKNATVTGGSVVGGAVGFMAGTVSNVSVTGTVTGYSHAGGLAGYLYGDVTEVDVAVDVEAHSRVGGMAGYGIGISVSEVTAVGDVRGKRFVGGLFGHSDSGRLSNSYATGTVQGEEDVGGLIGYARYSRLSTSYAVGSVTDGKNTGGLIGRSERTEVEDAYWDVDTTGQTSSDGGTGLSTAELTGSSVETVGFDVEETWIATEEYPWLVRSVSSFEAELADTVIERNESTQVRVTVTRIDGTTIDGAPDYESRNTTVATVDESGSVEATGVGNATITASSGTQTASVDLTVINETPSSDTERTTVPDSNDGEVNLSNADGVPGFGAVGAVLALTTILARRRKRR